MRSRSLLLALLVPAAGVLAACGGGEVTVRVMSTSSSQDSARAVEENVVTFLPYDRDSIFSAMTERAEEPEPEVPQDLIEQYDQVQEAGRQWRQAEQAWSQARDSLKGLRQRMDQLDRRSREYLQLFKEFDQLEGQVSSLKQRKNQLFERFDSLQKATLSRADSMQAVIRSWEDEAYAGYVELTDSILQEKGVEIVRDTTDEQGYVTTSLSGGDWWVYTRHEPGPFEELYWNIHVRPGQADTLVLSRENAEVRRKF